MRTQKLIFLFSVCSLFSCSDALLLERSEGLVSKKKPAAKVICIDPKFYFAKDELNYDLAAVQKNSKQLCRNIFNSAKSNKVQFELLQLDENAGSGYYEDLLKLRANMISVNFNQNTPLTFRGTYSDNEIQKKVFVYPPRISYEFNQLSKKYGTPYFSFVGFYVLNERLVLYHLVVDTDASETIYREYKTVKSNLNEEIMAQMVYDSYAMLAKEFEK